VEFTVDVAEVERLVAEADPAILFLCSPNNPTGTLEGEGVIGKVAAATPGLVVVDEAYGQFAPRSALADVDDDANLVVTRTFSKTWSMAALRLGYCVAPPRVVAALEQVALPYHLDAASQIAGRVALRFRAEMDARVGAVVAERERMVARLRELPVDLWPSAANFVLFRPRSRDGTDVWNDLVSRSVLVRNCSWSPRLKGCLRVTVGTPHEDDAFLAALAEVLV
jgi:histidinol-phosphate aminotransferase